MVGFTQTAPSGAKFEPEIMGAASNRAVDNQPKLTKLTGYHLYDFIDRCFCPRSDSAS